MSADDEWFFEPPEPPRDRQIDAAKRVLLERFFQPGQQQVYYGRQLEVLLEGQFFHWITKKGLNELVAERKIQFWEEVREHYRAHFYWPLRHRYARRQIAEIMGLITEFSHDQFTRAIGIQGETLADTGFARIGFRIEQSKVREVGGLKWQDTNHDLDRLVSRDGVRYGVEIKNQLGYIDQTEFEVKLAMCEYFEVRPMFIARQMPKNYIRRVVRQGGFCLLLDNQHYPILGEPLARRVRDRLSLPVLCIRELPDTTLRRFEAWHERDDD